MCEPNMMIEVHESLEEYTYGSLLASFIEDFIFEESIEVELQISCYFDVGIFVKYIMNWNLCFWIVMVLQMMWCLRTNGITLDELYNLDPVESFFEQEKNTG